MDRVVVQPYDKYKFEVAEEFSVTLNCIDFTIPKGFVTNGANIPRVFWSLYMALAPKLLLFSVPSSAIISASIAAWSVTS